MLRADDATSGNQFQVERELQGYVSRVLALIGQDLRDEPITSPRIQACFRWGQYQVIHAPAKQILSVYYEKTVRTHVQAVRQQQELERRWQSLSPEQQAAYQQTPLPVDWYCIYRRYVCQGHAQYNTSYCSSWWREAPCLILLGEPGMGKSWEWKQLKQNPTEQLHCFVNLGDFRSASQLFKRLERKPPVRQWLAQSGTFLSLWLDSFELGQCIYILHFGLEYLFNNQSTARHARR